MSRLPTDIDFDNFTSQDFPVEEDIVMRLTKLDDGGCSVTFHNNDGTNITKNLEPDISIRNDEYRRKEKLSSCTESYTIDYSEDTHSGYFIFRYTILYRGKLVIRLKPTRIWKIEYPETK